MTAEQRVQSGALVVADAIVTADQNWAVVKKKNIVIAEPKNDGSWLDPWAKALNAFKKSQDPA